MTSHVLDITGILLSLIFAATMFYHGHMIFHQKNGYSQKDEKKDAARMRHRIEQMLLKDK